MREIKFRAWHKADEKMYKVYGFSNGKWFLKGKSFPMPSGAVEIQQYTGLKDKNDREIYEGDIVFIYDDEPSESGWWENVIFHRSCFMAGDDNLLENVHFRCKVIGNKYEGAEKY